MHAAVRSLFEVEKGGEIFAESLGSRWLRGDVRLQPAARLQREPPAVHALEHLHRLRQRGERAGGALRRGRAASAVPPGNREFPSPQGMWGTRARRRTGEAGLAPAGSAPPLRAPHGPGPGPRGSGRRSVAGSASDTLLARRPRRERGTGLAGCWKNRGLIEPSQMVRRRLGDFMASSKTSPECPVAHRAAHARPTGLGERTDCGFSSPAGRRRKGPPPAALAEESQLRRGLP